MPKLSHEESSKQSSATVPLSGRLICLNKYFPLYRTSNRSTNIIFVDSQLDD